MEQVRTSTIIFLHTQINLLFIVSLNKLFRTILNNKITPIILNDPHYIKHPSILNIPHHIKQKKGDKIN